MAGKGAPGNSGPGTNSGPGAHSHQFDPGFGAGPGGFGVGVNTRAVNSARFLGHIGHCEHNPIYFHSKNFRLVDIRKPQSPPFFLVAGRQSTRALAPALDLTVKSLNKLI